MSAAELWQLYLAEEVRAKDHRYETWSFGDHPALADELLKLVLAGVKTGTASAYQLYQLENEPLPHIGAYSVILDGRGDAACIIQTTSVEIKPFDEVSAEHAALEGEGDLSLDYWRQGHQDFFSRELAAYGLSFSETMPVVCEVFRLCFTAAS